MLVAKIRLIDELTQWQGVWKGEKIKAVKQVLLICKKRNHIINGKENSGHASNKNRHENKKA
jgi:hypothetical protein